MSGFYYYVKFKALTLHRRKSLPKILSHADLEFHSNFMGGTKTFTIYFLSLSGLTTPFDSLLR